VRVQDKPKLLLYILSVPTNPSLSLSHGPTTVTLAPQAKAPPLTLDQRILSARSPGKQRRPGERERLQIHQIIHGPQEGPHRS
jgi:hypothetical protein